MSHLYLKTSFEQQADAWGGTEILDMYVDHNFTSDFTTFYNSDGSVVQMIFQDWSSGKDKWDAVLKLAQPFTGEWQNSPLKEGVEYSRLPWETKSLKS